MCALSTKIKLQLCASIYNYIYIMCTHTPTAHRIAPVALSMTQKWLQYDIFHPFAVTIFSSPVFRTIKTSTFGCLLLYKQIKQSFMIGTTQPIKNEPIPSCLSKRSNSQYWESSLCKRKFFALKKMHSYERCQLNKTKLNVQECHLLYFSLLWNICR